MNATTYFYLNKLSNNISVDTKQIKDTTNMTGIYDTLGLCSERTNPETGETEWFYSGGWHNQEWMDTYGPGCILDADWGPGDEYD